MKEKKQTQLNLKVRGRDELLYNFLRNKGVTNGQIFRLGLLTSLKKIEEVNPEEVEGLWEKIATNSILEDFNGQQQ